MKISIILPVKPPEPYLPELKRRIIESLSDYDCEILVQTETGLSNAVRKGVEKSTGSIIVVMDADGQHNPKHLPYMIDRVKLGEYLLCIGSRFINDSYVSLSPSELIVSNVYNNFARFFSGTNVRDCLTGFVVGGRWVFEEIKFADKTWKFLVEMLFYVNSESIYEHPISLDKRKGGFTNRKIRHSYWYFRHLLLCWYHYKIIERVTSWISYKI